MVCYILKWGDEKNEAKQSENMGNRFYVLSKLRHP